MRCSIKNNGLMKGSVSEGIMSLSSSSASASAQGAGGGRAERPKTLRGRLRNVYEPEADVDAQAADNGASQEKSLAILSPFDEQEEWAKINEIMASFGTGLVRESVFVTELEKEFQARLGVSRSESTVDSPCSVASSSNASISSVSQWLATLALADYEPLFLNYGFDHPDFINGVLEEKHLLEMGVTSEKDRATILESIGILACKVREAFVTDTGGTAMTNDDDDGGGGGGGGEVETGPVDEWLANLQLADYRDTFRRHLYTDMDKVKGVWDVELATVLEIEKPGHRQRILASLPLPDHPPTGRHTHNHPPPPNMDDLNADLSQLKNNIQQLKEEIRVKLPTEQQPAGNTGTLRHSHKKSRPAPPPPPGAAPDLEIRAPSELLVGVPATLTAQWRHRPQALLAGQLTYLASYLGSTVVRDMRGTESTKKSIQKLKKTTANEAATRVVPDIILSISYRGVRFYNALNQELVCEHEIRNIHCACQDAEDLTHFAYITKDHATKSHYCHVFCVQTMDQATEVILTLGQAFEVAYQMALRENFGSLNRMGSGCANGHGHNRSRSVANRIGGGQQSPVTAQPQPQSQTHGRSHSVNEIKIANGTTPTPTITGVIHH